MHKDKIPALRRDVRRAGSCGEAGSEESVRIRADEPEFTPVISSHNLRELEDICDSVGLLHKGKLLLTQDPGSDQVQYLQAAVCDPGSAQGTGDGKRPAHPEAGALRFPFDADRAGEPGGRPSSLARAKGAVFAEALPLTLEEIFISETEVAGYDIKDFLS